MDVKFRPEFDMARLVDEFKFERVKPSLYVRPIVRERVVLHLVANTRRRSLEVRTPFGVAAFMEAHKEKFSDLIEADVVEFVKGKFDR